MRNGYVLWVVLAVLALMTSMASLLYSQASLGEQISRNSLYHSRAKMAAQSGLEHFKSLGLHYDDLVQEGVEQQQYLLFEDDTLPNTRYRVFVTLGNDGAFSVNSFGDYISSGTVKASSQLAAQFITMEEVVVR
jgi:type II secretory pathway component PulK